MKLTINGEVKLIETPNEAETLEELIQQLGHHPRLVVVEYNGMIITPDQWPTQQIKDGDTLEIVTIVGGGS